MRRGAKVERERFDELGPAIAALERETEAIRSEGHLAPVRAIRDFEPADRVAARIELASGRMFRGRAAGVDVMGDGELVPFTGAVRREPLEPHRGETPFDAVRRALGR